MSADPATIPPETAPRPAIVVLAPDLFFAARFEDVIRAQGGQPVVVDTPDAFVAAVDAHFPVLALLDLNAGDGWQSALQRIKLRPATRQVPVIAFGSHVEADVLRAARAAGADHAWPRSKLMGDLPQVIADAVQPPVRYVEGWDAPMPEAARAGVTAFNQGDFFEQHEHFEHAWMQETRPIRELYQGILLVGVAFLQIEQHNWQGALKTFRRGLPRLRGLPPVCQGIDVAGLRAAAEAIHREITALGPDGLAVFDRARFPQIRLVDEQAHDPSS
jgi:CheY-like chemotaxis protein